jgi:DNA-binding PadR family transcriptional regulator
MTTYHALSAFQRDLLYAITAVNDYPDGIAVKAHLNEPYIEPIHHSRLYQNLSTLAEQDLSNRDELDARTNVYILTDAGRHLLQRHANTLSGPCDLPQPVADGGAQ